MSVISVIEQTTKKDFRYTFGNVASFFTKAYDQLNGTPSKILTNTQFEECFKNLISWVIDLQSKKIYSLKYKIPNNINPNGNIQQYCWNIMVKELKNKYINRHMPDDFPEDMQKYGYEKGYKKNIKVYPISYNDEKNKFEIVNGEPKDINQVELQELNVYCQNPGSSNDKEYHIFYSVDDNIYVNNFNEYDDPYSKFYFLCSLYYDAFNSNNVDIINSYLKEKFYEVILDKYRTKDINDMMMDKYELGEVFRSIPRTYEKLNSMAGRINTSNTFSSFARNNKSYLTIPFESIDTNDDGTTSFFVKKIPEWLLQVKTLFNTNVAEVYRKKLSSMSLSEKNAIYPHSYIEFLEGERNQVNYDMIDENGETFRYGERTYEEYYNNLIKYASEYKDEQKQIFIKNNLGFARPYIEEDIKSGNITDYKSYSFHKEASNDFKVVDIDYKNNTLEIILDFNTKKDEHSTYANIPTGSKRGFLSVGRLSQKLMDNYVSNLNTSKITSFYSIGNLEHTTNPNTKYETVEYNSAFDDRDVNIVHIYNDEFNAKIDSNFRLYSDKINKSNINNIGFVSNGKKYSLDVEYVTDDYVQLKKSSIFEELFKDNNEITIKLNYYSQGREKIYLNAKDENIENSYFNIQEPKWLKAI